MLSTVWNGGKLGAAYYDTETSQVHMLLDVIETSDFQFIRRGKQFNTSVEEKHMKFCIHPISLQS